MNFLVPNGHDAPPKLLLWDFDQALIVMTGFVAGVVSGFLLAGIVGSVFLAREYTKKKVGRHRMFVMHLVYWHLPSQVIPFPALPPSATREFIG